MKNRFKGLTEVLPPIYWLLWSGTLVNRLDGFVIPFLTLNLTSQHEIPVSQAALMISFYGAGSFIAQLTGGELTDRLGRHHYADQFFRYACIKIPLNWVQDIILSIPWEGRSYALKTKIICRYHSGSRIRVYCHNGHTV
jgi:MFS family permease